VPGSGLRTKLTVVDLDDMRWCNKYHFVDRSVTALAINPASPRAIAIALASDRAQKAMNLPSAIAPLPSVSAPLPQPLLAVALHGYAKSRYAIKRSPFAGC